MHQKGYLSNGYCLVRHRRPCPADITPKEYLEIRAYELVLVRPSRNIGYHSILGTLASLRTDLGLVRPPVIGRGAGH